MKQQDRESTQYVPPEVDVLQVQVERGFIDTDSSSSGGGGFNPPSSGGGSTSTGLNDGASADPWSGVDGIWE